MTMQVQAEQLVAAAEAEIEACVRRRSKLTRLLREVECRAEKARTATGRRVMRVRDAAVIKVKVLDGLAKQLREVLK